MALKDITVGEFLLGAVHTHGLKWGLEFEMDGRNMLAHGAPVGWRAIGDGSVPGGVEYVSGNPVVRVKEHVEKLAKYIEEMGFEVKESVRTSTHVHMNVQDLTLSQLAQVVIMFAVCEPAILPMCGEHRSGNFFAVPLSVSDEPLMSLSNCLVRGKPDQFVREGDNRYASLNVHSLSKFGTLEFRSFRGVKDPREILPWIEMLTRIRQEALNYESPQHLVEVLSMEGVTGFVSRVTGVQEVDEDAVYEVLRSAQFLAYRPNWNDAPPKVKHYIEMDAPEPNLRVDAAGLDVDFVRWQNVIRNQG